MKSQLSLRPTRASSGVSRITASLRSSRPFRFLWLSNSFFWGGVWTQTLVLSWLVYDTTGSEFLLALFTAARMAPLLLGPFSGMLSDRFDRVRLLSVACVWGFGAGALVAGMASTGRTPYWLLLFGGFAIGLAQSPPNPARYSLVLDFVGREQLSNANAISILSMNLMQAIGPALGGAMISGLGVPAALWISTAWYALALAALRPIRAVKTSRQAHQESSLRMLASGFRAVLSSRLTVAALMVTLAANIFIWPIYQAFVPIFAKDVLDLDAAGLGWLLMCGGLGGLAGSLVLASLGDFKYKGGTFVFGTAIWGLVWAFFALSDSVPLSFLLMICIGLASATFGVLQTTLLLMTTEPRLQGRALGMQELTIGIMPFSSLMIGIVANEIGVAQTAFVCAVLLMLTMLVLALRVPEFIRYSGREGSGPVRIEAQLSPDAAPD